MLAAWIFGSVFSVFLMVVMFLIPELTHGQMSLVRFFMASLAGFFAYFFVGDIALRGHIRGQKFAAGGGVALFVLIQLFVDPFAVRAFAGDHIPEAVRPDLRLKEVQEGLRRLQLLQKEPDGIRDSNTTAAIRSFQQHNNLRTDGALSRETLLALKAAVPLTIPPIPPLDSPPVFPQTADLEVRHTPPSTVEATASPRSTPLQDRPVLDRVTTTETAYNKTDNTEIGGKSKAKSDGPEVEVKCLVPENKVAEISEKLGIASKPPTLVRVVCFFDTGPLDLFQHDPKLILRSRYEPSKETDTTVKVRGGKVKGEDVKCEFDKVIGKEKTESCSITNKKQKEKEIKAANTGKEIKKIFSQKQQALAESTFEKVSWGKLQPYGPVEGVHVWKKIEMPGGPPLTVERWALPGRPGKPARVIFEVSAKVSLPEEDKTAKWIADLLGVSESGNEESETKTRIVLEHFAKHSP